MWQKSSNRLDAKTRRVVAATSILCNVHWAAAAWMASRAQQHDRLQIFRRGA